MLSLKGHVKLHLHSQAFSMHSGTEGGKKRCKLTETHIGGFLIASPQKGFFFFFYVAHAFDLGQHCNVGS